MKLLFSILFVIAVQYNLLAEKIDNPTLFTVKSIETDYIENGASGINITYNIDLSPCFASLNYSKDTIKDFSIFITTELFIGNKHINPNVGFINLYYKNESYKIKKRRKIKILNFNGSYDFVTKEDDLRVYEIFIPYAAMKIKNGEQNIAVKTIASSSSRDFKYIQKKINNIVTFNKPPTKEIHLYIESIVATYKKWDFNLFGMLNNSAPDMTVKVLLGDKNIWGRHIRDSYVFNAKKYTNIIFTCSENDIFNINIEDIDLGSSELIANLYFDLQDKLPGYTYLFNEPEQSIKSCNIEFTVE